MRRRRQRIDEPGNADEVNLTPMLDVVFIMLIFFIVTTSFVKESGVEIERPASSAASPQPDARLMVAITAKGAVWVDGEPVDAHRVGQRVAERLGDAGGVVIQADRTATTGMLLEVMDRLRAAGVEDLAVAATQSGS
ncbi:MULTISPECIES: ExbD/TolR family protein [Halomonas]|uniref:Outer membrane transport energization protein ExbD n=1 Tax=Halomonas ventosae TaxID=229007 RepID=A0A4R6HW72_9GAMM|nr:biopolymer transporter ExbD [Halomonas ventosae]TDO12635.1 outer membrane transport energization protein ExbD [Halomonas ventosae]